MIDTVVIPIAGLGTRMGPLTRVVPKALLPLMDRTGRLRTVLDELMMESARAGCQQAVVVVHPAHRRLVEDYLTVAGAPLRVSLTEAEPRGFGYAVLQARPIVGDRDFLLLLGDHVRRSPVGDAEPPREPSALGTLAAAHERLGAAATVAMQEVGPDQLATMGIAAGEPIPSQEGQNQEASAQTGLYRCRAFAEKPTLDHARRHLLTPGLMADRFLAHAGLYAFSRQIWPALEAVTAAAPIGQEVQLAAAQALLLEQCPQGYYLLRIGQRVYDTGSPAGYLEAVRAWSQA